jgi:hypothetical protein
MKKITKNKEQSLITQKIKIKTKIKNKMILQIKTNDTI